MGLINVLDFHVANLIAAGEVVERPASCVKELLENSIDSGAKKIVVEIKRGGVSFIRITDDGCGISREDLPVSILRHATSKIKNSEDLEGIATLGFRGEALAAISSVSRLRIMSKPKDQELGYVLESEYGEVIDIYESGMKDGTTVIVEELFSNVPARKKFLKRDASEGQACTAVVEKVVLSHPEISFQYIYDGVTKFTTDGNGNLQSAIYCVLGREYSSSMQEVSYLGNGIEVTGFISNPEYVRSNRNFENFFINGRYVKSKTVMAALERAYESFIPSDKFPACVLFLSINHNFVDVNVHPTKLEVKFSDERNVFDAVYTAVRAALASDIKRPNLSLPNIDNKIKNSFVPVEDREDVIDIAKKNQKQNDFFSQISSEDYKKINHTSEKTFSYHNEKIENTFKYDNPDISRLIDISKDDNEETEEVSENENTVVQPETPEIFYKIVGEAFYSYVIVEYENKLLVIDKHAAHERINFEKMKANLEKGKGESQMLLIPKSMDVEASGYGLLKENAGSLSDIGYDIDFDDSDHVITIKAYPSKLKESDAVDLIDIISAKLSDGTGNVESAFDSLIEKSIYQLSCKASIKAGHIEDEGHVKWICDNLLTLPDIKYCPHGRPVAFEITKDELDKQFKRK